MRNRDEHHIFYLTKKEKKGILVVLIVNILIMLSPQLISKLFVEKIPDNNRLLNACIALEKASENRASITFQRQQQQSIFTEKKSDANLHLFHFDPNYLSENDWKKFGVNDKTILTIKKYLSKGGHFKTPDDLKKIWGLSPILAEKLIPYVKIKQSNVSSTIHPVMTINKMSFPKNNIININTADSGQFATLQGIGTVLARRIILFRNKLGGFYTVDQIAEVWGLSDTIFQKIKNRLKIEDMVINLIDINKASLEQLKLHPYIGYKFASAIINFRNQHGYYKSLEDIQKIPIIDGKSYNKIVHYLAIKQL